MPIVGRIEYNTANQIELGDTQLNFTHVYSGNPVDRGEKERRDDQWIVDKSKDSISKFLPLRDASPVFLGLLDGTAHFTIDISAQAKAVAELSEGNGFRFVDARSVTEILSGPDSGIVAQARAQINWHNKNGS